jgi:hypothetical protein
VCFSQRREGSKSFTQRNKEYKVDKALLLFAFVGRRPININLPIVNHSSIAPQPMNGLRRNDDAMKNLRWYHEK